MKAALAKARHSSWGTTGIVPIGGGLSASFGSVTERGATEAIRMTTDLLSLHVPANPITWFDARGSQHTYTPDVDALTEGMQAVLLEVKLLGPSGCSYLLEAKYEGIGAYLRSERSPCRFGLVEWDPKGVFARNVVRLVRYWSVDPDDVATDAFEQVGEETATLGQIFDRVDISQWSKVYAAVANQRLVIDFHEAPISRATRVWMPSATRPPFKLADLVSKWWA